VCRTKVGPGCRGGSGACPSLARALTAGTPGSPSLARALAAGTPGSRKSLELAKPHQQAEAWPCAWQRQTSPQSHRPSTGKKGIWKQFQSKRPRGCVGKCPCGEQDSVGVGGEAFCNQHSWPTTGPRVVGTQGRGDPKASAGGLGAGPGR
jgi:hypothetical protein